jgi:hypothetical protein
MCIWKLSSAWQTVIQHNIYRNMSKNECFSPIKPW